MSTVDDDTHTEEPGTDIDETPERDDPDKDDDSDDDVDESGRESFPASDPPAH